MRKQPNETGRVAPGGSCAFYADDGHRLSIGIPMGKQLAEVSPHIFEEGETHTGCTVQELRCRRCGQVSFAWWPSGEKPAPIPEDDADLRAWILDWKAGVDQLLRILEKHVESDTKPLPEQKELNEASGVPTYRRASMRELTEMISAWQAENQAPYSALKLCFNAILSMERKKGATHQFHQEE